VEKPVGRLSVLLLFEIIIITIIIIVFVVELNIFVLISQLARSCRVLLKIERMLVKIS